jgi:hypothetical protein
VEVNNHGRVSPDLEVGGRGFLFSRFIGGIVSLSRPQENNQANDEMIHAGGQEMNVVFCTERPIQPMDIYAVNR